MAKTMTVTELTRATGIVDVEAGDAVEGDDADGPTFLFPNDGQTFLIFYAGAAAGDQLTFVGNNDEYGRAAASLTFTVAAGNTGVVGPFSPALFNNTNGLVQFAAAVGKGTDFFTAVRITNSQRNGA